MTEAQQDRDAEALKRLGYEQELKRGLGRFSSFALSFSIISILTGAVLLYGHGLKFAGPFVMLVGWPLVTVMTLAVAASMAELASAFPTAGALYHWAAILGGRGTGFTTAWLNVVGQFAVTAAIDFGMAEFVVDLLQLPGGRTTKLAMTLFLLVGHGFLNVIGVKVLDAMNWLSAWYHVLGVVVIVALLVALGPHQPVSILLARTTISEHGYLYGFAIGLLQAQWTFTGYDASAHVTEETIDPARAAPAGIIWSVVISGVAGWLLILAVTLATPDLAAAAASPDNTFIVSVTAAIGPTLGKVATWIAVLAMWFCGLASVTSNSRMLYAFARDGGPPGSAALAKVSKTRQTPVVAIWVSVGFAFGIAALGKILSVMGALSTIALYASYVVPVAAGLFARRSGRWTQRGPWNLGAWSTVVNVIAIAWVAFMTVVFVLPPNELAGWGFGGTLIAIALGWVLWARKHFRGPKVTLEGLHGG